jgi:hypothetical protein
MKLFIAVLVLIFSLQSWTKAGDISEFEIEGISIGDSLLDHYSEEEIKNFQKYYYPSSKEFFATGTDADSVNYDFIQMSVTNDDKYIIHSLSGKLLYKNNFEKCKKKMNLIIKDITNIFPENVEIRNEKLAKMPADKTGKSVNTNTTFFFQNKDYITVECSDWTDEMGFRDNLKVRFSTNFYNQWLVNEANN